MPSVGVATGRKGVCTRAIERTKRRAVVASVLENKEGPLDAYATWGEAASVNNVEIDGSTALVEFLLIAPCSRNESARV